MKKKILITGVAGMIGSTVLEAKLKKNNIIYGFDNFLNKNSIKLKKFLLNKNFIFKKKDVSLKTTIFKKKILFDEIWLLAANSDIKTGIRNSNVDYQNTFLTTYNFLNSIRWNLKKSTKIIFTSSSAIYGDLKNKKIKLNYGPYKPISNYGAMKAASENFLAYFCQNNNIKYYIFRLPNVISEKFTHGIINDFIKKNFLKKKYFQVLGNGNQRKPYVHADELVALIEKIINIKKFKNQFFNLTPNDNGVTVKYIAQRVKFIFQSKKKIIYEKKKYGWKGDVPIYSYANSLKKYKYLQFKLSSKQAINKVLINILNDRKN